MRRIRCEPVSEMNSTSADTEYRTQCGDRKVAAVPIPSIQVRSPLPATLDTTIVSTEMYGACTGAGTSADGLDIAERHERLPVSNQKYRINASCQSVAVAQSPKSGKK